LSKRVQLNAPILASESRLGGVDVVARIGWGVLAAAAAVIAGCSSRAETHRSGTATYGGLVLRPPTSWQSVGVEFTTAALVQPLGYLTNQSPVPECRPDATGHTACGPPVAHLARAGVLVVINDAPLPALYFKPTTTVAGLPATVDRPACVDCPFGARYQIKATVHVPSSSGGVIETVQVFGYFSRGNSGGQRRAFERMLATATHQ
jgi:hypothetical protein